MRHTGKRLFVAALLAVRPNAVRLSANGPGLAARVARAAYLGGHMEYGIDLPGLDTELFAIAPDVTSPHTAGQDIHVTFDPAGIAVVRPG